MALVCQGGPHLDVNGPGGGAERSEGERGLGADACRVDVH